MSLTDVDASSPEYGGFPTEYYQCPKCRKKKLVRPGKRDCQDCEDKAVKRQAAAAEAKPTSPAPAPAAPEPAPAPAPLPAFIPGSAQLVPTPTQADPSTVRDDSKSAYAMLCEELLSTEARVQILRMKKQLLENGYPASALGIESIQIPVDV